MLLRRLRLRINAEVLVLSYVTPLRSKPALEQHRQRSDLGHAAVDEEFDASDANIYRTE